MVCYGDTTYCISLNCTGKCGRQLTDAIESAAIAAGLPIAMGYFCGRPAPSATAPQHDEQDEQDDR